MRQCHASTILNGCGLLYRGTVEDTELVEGLVLEQKVSHMAGGVTRVEKAKIGLIQFCISPPKTDVRRRERERDREGGREGGRDRERELI